MAFPLAAGLGAAQGDDRVGAVDGPVHSGLFGPLTDDGLQPASTTLELVSRSHGAGGARRTAWNPSVWQQDRGRLQGLRGHPRLLGAVSIEEIAEPKRSDIA